MAMNKKEQAEMAEMEKNVRLAKALRWTDRVEKDIPAPSSFKSTSGFVFNSYYLSVDPAWSESVSHGIGRSARDSRISGSQRAIAMFSTRLLALRGLRNAVESAAAEKLAAIDKEIERELAQAASGDAA